MAAATKETLKITLTSGLVGKQERQKAVVRALGLKKYGSSVVREKCPTIMGMLHKVSHLVTVAPGENAVPKGKSTRGKTK
jgi:large subunit ribosomal protein L30